MGAGGPCGGGVGVGFLAAAAGLIETRRSSTDAANAGQSLLEFMTRLYENGTPRLQSLKGNAVVTFRSPIVPPLAPLSPRPPKGKRALRKNFPIFS